MKNKSPTLSTPSLRDSKEKVVRRTDWYQATTSDNKLLNSNIVIIINDAQKGNKD